MILPISLMHAHKYAPAQRRPAINTHSSPVYVEQHRCIYCYQLRHFHLREYDNAR
jgi:hypothetical protein